MKEYIRAWFIFLNLELALKYNLHSRAPLQGQAKPILCMKPPSWFPPFPNPTSSVIAQRLLEIYCLEFTCTCVVISGSASRESHLRHLTIDWPGILKNFGTEIIEIE